jgi:hypothetical protein
MAAKFENPRRGNRHVTRGGASPRRLARGASEKQKGDEIGAGRHAGWIQSGADDGQAAPTDSHFVEKRADVCRRWLEVAKHWDYREVQTYSRSIAGNKDLAAPAGAALTQVGWEYYPECAEHMVRYASTETGVPILVRENGIATTDEAGESSITRGRLPLPGLGAGVLPLTNCLVETLVCNGSPRRRPAPCITVPTQHCWIRFGGVDRLPR